MNPSEIPIPQAGEPPNPEITPSKSEQSDLNRELQAELGDPWDALSADEKAREAVRNKFKGQKRVTTAALEKQIAELAPADGIIDVDGKKALKARKRAGLSNREWSVAAIKAKLQFGNFLTVPIVSKISLVGVMNSLQQVEEVIKFGTEIASGVKKNKDGTILDLKVSDQDKIHAVSAVADATKIHMEAVLNAIKVAEHANGKPEQEAGNKPRNKPPSLGIETVTPDGTTTRVVATSGSPA